MSTERRPSRLGSTAAAALLLFAGGVLGVVVDRLWLAPPAVSGSALTVDAMVQDLGLPDADARRVRAFVDSMHPVVSAAAAAGPDSLMSAARGVHRRLEALVPPEARPRLRGWMGEHHRHMLDHMRP